MTKIEKLATKIPNGFDAVIILTPQNRLYFTSLSSSDGVLVVTKNEALLAVDGRYIEVAKNIVTDCNVILIESTGGFYKNLFKKLNIKHAVVESKITIEKLNILQQAAPEVEIASIKAVDCAIDDLRAIKDTDEASKIRCAQRACDLAFSNILDFIHEGVTEIDIALQLEFIMRKNGASGVSFETIVVSGIRGSLPHGVPLDKQIKKGEFITMDFGAIFEGYCSDMTRTVAVGKINEKQRNVYETVLEAQGAALNNIKPDAPCYEIDKAARDVIDSAGYGKYFNHSTGHGVGIEVHEIPSLSPSSKQILKKGNVVTVEPGVYIPGEIGVRIEDFVLITDLKYENLTHSSKELIII